MEVVNIAAPGNLNREIDIEELVEDAPHYLIQITTQNSTLPSFGLRRTVN